MNELPMQPLEIDEHGVVRFRGNKIIDHLYSQGMIDLNRIAALDFPAEDRMQLAMLLGYSVSGFGDLSYATPAVVSRADAEADALIAEVRDA